MLAILVMVLAVSGGCLTSEQRAEIEAIRLNLADAAQRVEALVPVKERLETALTDLITALKAKKIPLEEFQALSKVITEEKTKVEAEIAALSTSVKEGQARIAALQAQGVPWWEIAGGILVSVLLGGLGIKQRGIAVSERSQKEAVILGVEKALKTVPQADASKILNAITKTASYIGIEPELHASVKALTGDSNRK